MSDELDKLSSKTSVQFIVLIVALLLALHSAFSDPLQTRQYLSEVDYSGQTILPVIVPLETTTSILKSKYNANEVPLKILDKDSKEVEFKRRHDYLNGILKENALRNSGTTMTKTQIALLMHNCYGQLNHDQMLFLQKYGDAKYWGFRAVLLHYLWHKNTMFDDDRHQNPTHGSHHICTCLKEFSIQTDLIGDWPNTNDKFNHKANPQMTDCQLQDLSYQSSNDGRMLEDYLSDVPQYIQHDFQHSDLINASAVMRDLLKAMPIHLITQGSPIEELLVYVRNYNNVENYNKQYIQYSTYAEDKNWIEHSQAASIKMCMHHAVPVLVSSVEEYVGVQVHYKFGEHLLLLAVFVALYFWSEQNDAEFHQIKTINQVQPASQGQASTSWLNSRPYQVKMVSTLTWLTSFICKFVVFGILISSMVILNNKLEQINLKDNYYWTAILSGGLQSDVLPLQIIATISLILWLVLFLAVLFIGWTKFYVEDRTQKECTVVGCMVFDICIILGLAHMAITMSVLRGITSAETILLVFLLVLSIGLLQHLSNLTMFVLQISKTVQVNLTSKIAFHRFAGAILSLIMLWAVYSLATTTFAANTADVVYSQTSNFIFLVAAFCILHAYDIWVETAVQFQAMTDPYQASSFITKKHYYTAWIIVVTIVILNIQRYLLLCGKEDVHALDNQVCKSKNVFAYIFGPMDNSHTNHFFG